MKCTRIKEQFSDFKFKVIVAGCEQIKKKYIKIYAVNVLGYLKYSPSTNNKITILFVCLN